jgi:hypothetical protein
MVAERLILAVREHRPQTIHRLALPCAHLIGVNLVPGRDLLDRLVPRSASSATLALKSDVNFRRFVIPYPSVAGGIHLKNLSDFLGPAQVSWISGSSSFLLITTISQKSSVTKSAYSVPRTLTSEISGPDNWG